MAWTKAAREKALATKRAKGSTNQYTKAKLEGRTVEVSLETRQKMGAAWLGKNHSDESKALIAEKAKASTHRRLLKSTRVYAKLDGTQVLLDSSWEEELAKRLDFLRIEWERPSQPLKWTDESGNVRNYFPDFWLPGFGIYLDPKNPAAASQQKEKIKWLKENRTDVIIIASLRECKEFCPW